MTDRIKLMAEHKASPLWWAGNSRAGPIELSTLNLSKETVERLQAWNDRYTARLNWNDPGNSEPVPRSTKAEFDREGLELWRRVQKELGDEYKVVYFSDLLDKVIEDPAELRHELEI